MVFQVTVAPAGKEQAEQQHEQTTHDGPSTIRDRR
jgi:hypothetical protein